MTESSEAVAQKACEDSINRASAGIASVAVIAFAGLSFAAFNAAANVSLDGQLAREAMAEEIAAQRGAGVSSLMVNAIQSKVIAGEVGVVQLPVQAVNIDMDRVRAAGEAGRDLGRVAEYGVSALFGFLAVYSGALAVSRRPRKEDDLENMVKSENVPEVP